MKRILFRLCSRVSRHQSHDTQQTGTFPNPIELAEGQTRLDHIRKELATLSARVCEGHLRQVDMLIEDTGLQIGLSFSEDSRSEIPTETKIYSAPSGPSEVDLATCYLSIKERLNHETLALARDGVRRLNSIPAPEDSAASALSASRTILLNDIDRWNFAQITCVGTEEPHLILGAYRIPSSQDASLGSLSLAVLVQNGAPSGGLRLRPFQPGSNLVKTESENLTERAREDRDDSWHSEDSE